MSTLHDTAEAVKALIDGATLSKAFDPRFCYDTDLPLEDAGTLHVDVVASGLSCVPDSRVSLRYEALVDIAVRYRFGTAEHETDGSIDVDEIEEYIALLEEIGELLATPGNRQLATKVTATWIGNEIRFPWVPEHMRTNRQYTGILRATYYVAKDF
ncbi:MAG: hypothetical protein ACYC4U_11395 [Pirellulaceae bacterium]